MKIKNISSKVILALVTAGLVAVNAATALADTLKFGNVEDILINTKSGNVRIVATAGEQYAEFTDDFRVAERSGQLIVEQDKTSNVNGNITISGTSGGTTIISGGSNITISKSGKGTSHITIGDTQYVIAGNGTYKIGQNGEQIEVSRDELQGVKSELTLYLSQQEIDNLSVKATSGTVVVDGDGIVIDTVRANLTSGSVSLNGVTADSIGANITSGNITMQGGSANNINFSATSGNIIANVAGEYDARVDATSGNQHLEGETRGAANTINASVTSGNVDVRIR